MEKNKYISFSQNGDRLCFHTSISQAIKVAKERADYWNESYYVALITDFIKVTTTNEIKHIKK